MRDPADDFTPIEEQFVRQASASKGSVHAQTGAPAPFSLDLPDLNDSMRRDIRNVASAAIGLLTKPYGRMERDPQKWADLLFSEGYRAESLLQFLTASVDRLRRAGNDHELGRCIAIADEFCSLRNEMRCYARQNLAQSIAQELTGA